MSADDDKILDDFLKQRGHTDQEIIKIKKRMAAHDSDAVRESIFDSIAGGTFNFDDIIKQALEGD